MKKYLILFILCFSLPLMANKMKEVEDFSKRPLNANSKQDLEAVKKTLKTLLELDDEDPSRTAVMMLSKSYNKNQKIYDKAFKAIENKKNKTQLLEIKELMAHLYKDGNG